MADVTVVGAGYVGLVTAACLAEIGHRVVCLDNDETKVARLQEGEIPIFEPGLDELVAANAARGRLRFASRIADAVGGGADVVFIAVGTPSEANGGGANLSYVFAAADEAARAIAASGRDGFTVFVTKSTVPVGTGRKVGAIATKQLPPDRFAVASNPEFLREGAAIRDFMEPDRIIVGSPSEQARTILEHLYQPLTRKGRPLIATSTVETAELIKYAANAFLATKVTFINELSRLCEATGADVGELALGIGLDPRIGASFLSPGPGFGGSCFPKDLRALTKTANDFASPVEIVETVLRVNDRHKLMMVRKVRAALGNELQGRRIAVLGLAFKANTDDMRDAPALTILPQLMAEGATIRAYDPAAARQAAILLPDIDLADSAEAAVEGADAVVILTEWPEFQALPWQAMAATMRGDLVIDLRNVLAPAGPGVASLDYVSIGRLSAPAGRRKVAASDHSA